MSGADGAAPGNDGHPGFLTPEQDAKVAALKGMISATMASPGGQHLVRINGGEEVELCRLLRARDWDAEKARILWEEILEYRRQNNLDSVVKKYLGDAQTADPKNVKYKPLIMDAAMNKVINEMPCARWGFCSNGSLLEIWRVDKLRPMDIMKRCTVAELTDWWHFWVESALESGLIGAQASGKAMRGTVVVYDLKGFGAKHLHTAMLRILISLFGIGQSKFPESLYRVFIVNAPTIFSGTWTAIKPVLNARTRRKIIMTNKPMCDELAALIPRENLPHFLGGPVQCDIGETIGAGGVTMKSVNVGARSDLRVTEEVPEGGYLGWEFRTEGGKDIKFAVYRFAPGTYSDKSPLTSGEVIVENHKAGAGEQDTVQDTKINLRSGTYVLHFDNTYSMMTGKSFSYTIDVGGGEQSPLPTSGDYPSFGSSLSLDTMARAIGESVVTGVPTPEPSPMARGNVHM